MKKRIEKDLATYIEILKRFKLVKGDEFRRLYSMKIKIL